MFGVKYLYFKGKDDRICEVTKFYKTEKAMLNHLQKMEDSGKLYKILSYLKDN